MIENFSRNILFPLTILSQNDDRITRFPLIQTNFAAMERHLFLDDRDELYIA